MPAAATARSRADRYRELTEVELEFTSARIARMPSKSTLINAKLLRDELPRILERVRRGERFTVVYRSRPVFRIVPVDAPDVDPGPVEDDPLYQAGPIGRSRDGKTSKQHDEILYGRRR
jgi:prevent-host-death family protein